MKKSLLLFLGYSIRIPVHLGVCDLRGPLSHRTMS